MKPNFIIQQRAYRIENWFSSSFSSFVFCHHSLFPKLYIWSGKAYFFVGAEAIDPIGDEFRKGGDVAFVLSDVEQIDRQLVARLHHHLARCCTRSHYPYLDPLTQSQQRSPMLGSDDEIHIVALHPMELTASLKSMFHRRIDPPSILLKFNGI